MSRTMICVVVFGLAGCQCSSSGADGGAGGGSAGGGSPSGGGTGGGAGGGSVSGGGPGGGAGGGSASGGGSGGDLCADPAATCQAFGIRCGQAQLACGLLDCGTCSLTPYAAHTGGEVTLLSGAGLPQGAAFGFGLGGSVPAMIAIDTAAGDGGVDTASVPDAGNLGYFAPVGLARAPDGGLWVSYAASSSVYVASSANGYQPARVGLGDGSAISIDPDGAVHVAMGRTFASGVLEGFLDGGAWQTAEVDDGGINQVAIASAPDGSIHLIYADATSGAIKHASRATPGTYSLETVAPGSPQGWVPAGLVISPDGTLHAAWINGTTLSYAVKPPGGAWSVLESPFRSMLGSYLAIALDRGHPAIVYVGELGASSYYVAPVGDAGLAIQQLNPAQTPWVALAGDQAGGLFLASDSSVQGGYQAYSFARYPDDYRAKFTQMVHTLCTQADACRGDAGFDCCVSGNCVSPCLYCESDIGAELWRVTIDAGAVDACLGALGNTTCGPGNGMPEAVAPPECEPFLH